MFEENLRKTDNLINLETTSKYQPLTDTNIQFYNMDIGGTSELNFMVTKDNNPLLISDNNVDAHIGLVAQDGSKIVDDLEFIDPLNGLLRFTLPNEFLKHSGKVIGQVYIALHGAEDTVVQRMFSFNIADDLISSFDAVTKLTYIRMFNDLYEVVRKDVNDIRNAIQEGADHVSVIHQQVSEGITQIQNIKGNVLDEVNNLKTSTLNELETKTNGFLNNVDSRKNDINTRLNEVKQQISGADLVKNSDTIDWQKHKLTDDEGLLPEVENWDMNNLDLYATDTKLVHVTNAINSPSEYIIPIDEEDVPEEDVLTTGTTGTLLLIITSTGGRAIWYPDDDVSIYTSLKNGGVWTAWKKSGESSVNQDDLNTALEEQKNEVTLYADTLNNNRNVLLYESVANGVDTLIDLNGNYNDFLYLVIYGTFSGGDFVSLGETFTGNNIVIRETNVTDAEGVGGGHYECQLKKVNLQQLQIVNDVYWDFGLDRESGANANKFTINRIIGVR